jgi:rhomboid protease GluP
MLFSLPAKPGSIEGGEIKTTMATDGDIDFTTYTREQLDSAVSRMNRERYPINAQNLVAEYQRRQLEEKKAAGLARDSGSMMPAPALGAAKSPEATYEVHFGKVWSGSRARNSFQLSRRGEIGFSGDTLIVRAFRSEMLFMGSRIELTFARADITDVSHLANYVSLHITRPNLDQQKLGFWTRDEEDAKKIVQALPSTVSMAGTVVKEYEAQLQRLERGDYVTKALVVVNILVFAAADLAGAGFFVPNAQVLASWGTNFGPLTMDGQWWRLVSSMFLHFGVFHLALNMWALYVGGRLAERLFGSQAYALLYFASGIAGSLSSLLWNPAVNSAGASGAIFGVYGAMLAFFLRKHSAIPPAIISQQRWSGITFIGFNLMNGFSNAGIDNAAHIGGLSVGFVMGLILARPLSLEARTRISAATFYTRGGLAALALLGLLFLALRFSPASDAVDQRFRRDLQVMSESETVARKSANDAFEQLRSHQITERELAERIENDVVPRWELIQKTVQRDRVADDSKMKPLWELLSDYSESRLAAFQLYASAARTGKKDDLKKAQAKIDQGDIDLKLISDLNQGRQK